MTGDIVSKCFVTFLGCQSIYFLWEIRWCTVQVSLSYRGKTFLKDIIFFYLPYLPRLWCLKIFEMDPTFWFIFEIIIFFYGKISQRTWSTASLIIRQVLYRCVTHAKYYINELPCMNIGDIKCIGYIFSSHFKVTLTPDLSVSSSTLS